MLAVLHCTMEIQAGARNKFLIVLCWLLTGRIKARTPSISCLSYFGLLSSRFSSFYGDWKRNLLFKSSLTIVKYLSLFMYRKEIKYQDAFWLSLTLFVFFSALSSFCFTGLDLFRWSCQWYIHILFIFAFHLLSWSLHEVATALPGKSGAWANSV